MDAGPSGDAGTPGRPAAGVPSRPALPAGWTEFREPDYGFSVFTPGTAHSSGGNAFPLPGGMAGPATYGGEGQGLQFHLSAFERNPAEVPALRQTFYANGSTGMAGLGQVQSRQDVTWAGHPAVEFELQSRDERTVFRLLNVGNRFYSAWIAGQGEQPTADERAAFFGSFTL